MPVGLDRRQGPAPVFRTGSHGDGSDRADLGPQPRGQQENARVHWHVAALPPGVPYEDQQFRALIRETNGVLAITADDQAGLAEAIRSAMTAIPYRQAVPMAAVPPTAGGGTGWAGQDCRRRNTDWLV